MVYGADVATDSQVTIVSENVLEEKNITSGICAIRGSVDTDRFLIIGTYNFSSTPPPSLSFHMLGTLSFRMLGTRSFHMLGTLSFHMLGTLSFHMLGTLSFHMLGTHTEADPLEIVGISISRVNQMYSVIS